MGIVETEPRPCRVCIQSLCPGNREVLWPPPWMPKQHSRDGSTYMLPCWRRISSLYWRKSYRANQEKTLIPEPSLASWTLSSDVSHEGFIWTGQNVRFEQNLSHLKKSSNCRQWATSVTRLTLCTEMPSLNNLFCKTFYSRWNNSILLDVDVRFFKEDPLARCSFLG